MITRKHVVTERIERLPKEERPRARELYSILDTIEWNIVLPRSMGVFGIFALLALQQVFPKAISFLPNGEGAVAFATFIMAIVTYALGVLFLNAVFFSARREASEKCLRALLSSSPSYQRTLDTILELDPDIARTIRKPLSLAIAAAKQPYAHHSDIE